MLTGKDRSSFWEENGGRTLVIVGPTGSGKTGLAIEAAEMLGGEVISADSRAIYKGMDIGTAKPTKEEMRGIVHWGIDLVGPSERFTVFDFQKYAKAKEEDIRGRGKLPIVAGGTGLYVDALVYDYKFSNVVKKNCSDRREMCSKYVIIGISWSYGELRDRLIKRANNFFAQDIVGETKRVMEMYQWGSQALKSNIYEIVWRMINGEINEDEAKRLFFLEDWHLARRQMTWFRRNKNIVWLRLDDCREYLYNLGR